MLAPTTTGLPAVVSVATTVAAADEYTREALEALVRCKDALHPFLAEAVALGGDDLDVAAEACDEASLQLEVDGIQGTRLTANLAELGLTLSFANLAVMRGDFDAIAQGELQSEIDRFAKVLAAALD